MNDRNPQRKMSRFQLKKLKDDANKMSYYKQKYKELEEQQLSFEDEVKQLVHNIANDMELGGKIRELCFE